MKFKNVKEFYLFMAQGNCCHPKWEDLTINCKSKWIEDFNKYILEVKQSLRRLFFCFDTCVYTIIIYNVLTTQQKESKNDTIKCKIPR